MKSKILLFAIGLALSESSFAAQACFAQVNSFLKAVNMGSFDHPENGTSKKPRVRNGDLMGITGDGRAGYEFSRADEKVYVFPPKPSAVVELAYEGHQFLGSEKNPDLNQTTLSLDVGCKVTDFISKHHGISFGGSEICTEKTETILKRPFMNKSKIPAVQKICKWLSENGMLESANQTGSQPPRNSPAGVAK